MGIFFKKSGSVTYNYIRAPNTMLCFRKKTMSQFQENLPTDGRTDRRMDGRPNGRMDRKTDRPYFIGPFWPRLGV